MQALQSPLMVLSSKCKLPLTLPQVMGLLQGAQSQARLRCPAVCQEALPTAQTVGVPGTSVPAQSAPARRGRTGHRPAARARRHDRTPR